MGRLILGRVLLPFMYLLRIYEVRGKCRAKTVEAMDSKFYVGTVSASDDPFRFHETDKTVAYCPGVDN